MKHAKHLPSRVEHSERNSLPHRKHLFLLPLRVILVFLVMTVVVTLAAYAQGASVLIIWDTNNSNTQSLKSALEGAGMTVTLSDTSETGFDGTNPSLAAFDAVIHLNGTTATTETPTAGQEALVQFVQDGGGYLGNEWNSYEIKNNRMRSMRDLILFNRLVENVFGATTVADEVGMSGHPILANVPSPFSFSAGLNSGTVHSFAESPVTVLMRDTSRANGSPAIAVRELGLGRVVAFHHSGNWSTYNTLSDVNIQQLYIDGVLWAKREGEQEPVAMNGTMFLDEGTIVGALIGTVVAVDPAGSPLTFTITAGNDEGFFAIDSETGDITLAGTFGDGPYALTVEVTNESALSDTAIISIYVRHPDRSVLILWDVIDVNTLSLKEALEKAGMLVTFSDTSEGSYDGTNPNPDTFRVVIHLDGKSWNTAPMPAGGQAALVNYVQGGGGYIGTERLAHEMFLGRMLGLRELVLFDFTQVNSNNATVNDATGMSGHPILANVPFSFTFRAGVTKGTLHSFAVDAATTLMEDSRGGPAVAVRDFGCGRVVGFHHAGNFDRSTPPFYDTLADTNVQQLFVDGAYWAMDAFRCNSAPVADDGTFSIDENSSLGSIVGTVSASDADNDPMYFSIESGNDDGVFAIDWTSGEIVLLKPIDHETLDSYALVVKVRDFVLFDTAAITININDVNEPPSMNTPPVLEIDENAPAGTFVGTVSATDVDDGDILDFSIILGNVGDAFAIGSSGDITVAGDLNFEIQATYVLTVEVTDSGSLSDTSTVWITINDVDEPPVVSPATFTIDENSSVGELVGTVDAYDPEGEAINFSIESGNAGNVFTISSGGAILVSGALDYETVPSYILTVKATDPSDLSGSAAITVLIGDILEVPVFELANVVVDDSLEDSHGNNDMQAQSGEKMYLDIYLGNTGNADGTNVSAKISNVTLDGQVLSVIEEWKSYPLVVAGGNAEKQTALHFQDISIPTNLAGTVRADITIAYGNESAQQILLNQDLFTVEAAAWLSVAPSEYYFGVSGTDADVTVSVQVMNNGSKVMIVSAITPSDVDVSWAGTSLPWSLLPGASETIDVAIDTALLDGENISRQLVAVSDARIWNPGVDDRATITGLVSDGVYDSEILDATGSLSPDVSGTLVVWEDTANASSDIFAYDITLDTTLPICIDSADQHNPRISGDLVAWDDLRNWDGQGDPELANCDIYAYDIAAEQEILVANDAAREQLLGVDGTRIVFRRSYYTFSENSVEPHAWNLYVYDQGTDETTQITNFSGGNDHIDRGTVLGGDFGDGLLSWTESTLYWASGTSWETKDLNSLKFEFGADSFPVQLPNAFSNQAANDSKIAWAEQVGGKEQVFVWEAGTSSQLTTENTSHAENMLAIGGNFAAYDKNGMGGAYYLDIDTGTEDLLVPQGQCRDARMDNHCVVWRHYENNAWSLRYAFLGSDLSLVATDILPSPAVPSDDELVDFTVSVWNLGKQAVADSITVNLFDGDPTQGGSPLGNPQTIIGGLSGRTKATVVFNGLALSEGDHVIYATCSTSEFENVSDNVAFIPISVLDSDTQAPVISNVSVDEHLGDGDGFIENNEQVAISWTLDDASGIDYTYCTVDDLTLPVIGSYLAISAPLTKGEHLATITAADADTSPETMEPWNVAFNVYPSAPSITSASPASGATEVEPEVVVEVTFADDILASTAVAEAFTLTTPGKADVGGTVTYESVGRVMQFTPSEALAYGTEYTATLSSGPQGITDLIGNHLEADYSWSFTTVNELSMPMTLLVPFFLDNAPAEISFPPPSGVSCVIAISSLSAEALTIELEYMAPDGSDQTPPLNSFELAPYGNVAWRPSVRDTMVEVGASLNVPDAKPGTFAGSVRIKASGPIAGCVTSVTPSTRSAYVLSKNGDNQVALVPFFLDNAPADGTYPPSSLTSSYIGLKSLSDSAITVDLEYLDYLGENQTPDAHSFELGAYDSTGWRPCANDPVTEGAGTSIPDALAGMFAGSLRVSGTGPITGRVVSATRIPSGGSVEHAYALPVGNGHQVVVVPFLLDNAPADGLYPPASGTATFIGIKNVTSNTITVSVEYKDYLGIDQTPDANSFELEPYGSAGWRPCANDPGTEGAFSGIPDAKPGTFAGSARIITSGAIVGRVVASGSSAESAYELPGGQGATTLVAPFFEDDAPADGLYPPGSGTASYIGIKNLTGNPVTITVEYTDRFGNDQTPENNQFVIGAYAGLGWRPCASDPVTEGDFVSFPDMTSGQAGSVRITASGGLIAGRLVAVTPVMESAYRLPGVDAPTGKASRQSKGGSSANNETDEGTSSYGEAYIPVINGSGTESSDENADSGDSSETDVTGILWSADPLFTVTPGAALVVGGSPIAIKCEVLNENCLILVNDRDCANVAYDGERGVLSAIVPPGVPGPAVVTVEDLGAGTRYELTNVFTYTEEPFFAGLDISVGIVRTWIEGDVVVQYGYLSTSNALMLQTPQGIEIAVPHELRKGYEAGFIIVRSAGKMSLLYPDEKVIFPENTSECTPVFDIGGLVYDEETRTTFEIDEPFAESVRVKFPVSIGSVDDDIYLGAIETHLDWMLRPFFAVDLDDQQEVLVSGRPTKRDAEANAVTFEVNDFTTYSGVSYR